MNRGRLLALASLVAICSFTPMAYAQNFQSWVSGNGNDAYPCSRLGPCLSLARALTMTGKGGEILSVDPWTFLDLGITIDKSITIDGIGGGRVGVIGGFFLNGLNINITAAGDPGVVILRNLDLNGGKLFTDHGFYGINIIAAGEVRIENCKIYGWNGRGINDSRASGKLFVKDTVISNNGDSGIAAAAAGGSSLSIVLTRVQMESNGNAGLAVTQGAQATLVQSSASGNASFGFFSSGSVVNLQDSVASWNTLSGVAAYSGGTIRISNTTVNGNGKGLEVSGGGNILSYGFNRIDGNGSANGPPTGTLALQ